MVEDEHRALSPGTVVAGKLRVVRLLGAGGMGAVYEVEHEITKHRRALKMLHKEMTLIPGVVARFLREASAAGRIGSPQIIETFDAGQLETGEPYIVMELLKGRPLDDLIAEKGHLDYAECLDLLKQACRGVQAAHDAGIIHRDLKPENLFLVAGERPFVKILDFGISKFDPSRTGDHKLTQEGTALGTPFYMPPEQVRGETIDERADVYALGVVLYECVTGQKPFVSDSLPHIAVLIHEGKYQAVSALRPDVPAALEQAIARAMSVDRDARYSSARELELALHAVELGESIANGHTIAAPTALDGTPAGVIGRDARRASEDFATSATQLAPAVSVLRSTTSGTGAGVAIDPRARPRGRTALWIALAAAAVAAAGLAVVLGGRDAEPATPTTEEPETAAPALPAPTDPTVAPILGTTMPESSASAAVPAPAASVAPSAATPVAQPKAVAPPAERGPVRTSTRASKHGLAEENPF